MKNADNYYIRLNYSFYSKGLTLDLPIAYFRLTD